MYINADKVTMLHVEPTSKCNASCPGCPRNNYGFGVNTNLILQSGLLYFSTSPPLPHDKSKY